MNVLKLKTPEDIAKLAGCHIHSAKLITVGPMTHLELVVDHIEMPNKVTIEIWPNVKYLAQPNMIMHQAGLFVGTSDTKEESHEQTATDSQD